MKIIFKTDKFEMVDSKKITQKERVFRAVIAILGDKYDPSEPVYKHFLPINTLKGLELPKEYSSDWALKNDEANAQMYKTQGLSIVNSHDSQKIHLPRNLVKRLDKVGQSSATQFFKGPLPVEYKENPLLTKLIQLANVPRGAIFESFRRDSRLNGGVKRARQKSISKTVVINKEEYTELKDNDILIKSILAELKNNQEARNLLLLKLQTRKFELFLKANNLKIEDMDSDLQKDLFLNYIKSA